MAEYKDIFPSNSNRSLEKIETESVPERVHAKPVAKRLAGKKQETTLQKFRNLIFADDINDIGDYLVKDLIVPTIKDVFLNFMNALLWGDRRSGNGYRDNSRQRTNYNRISSTARVETPRRSSERTDYNEERNQFNVDNIVFATKAEAEEILAKLEDYIEDYGQVTVGYLYELMDESGPWTVEYYGWRSLRSARITRVQNGYSLDLPRPIRLEK